MMKSQTGIQSRRRFRLTDDDLWGYAFILIAMIAFGVFTLYPVISAVETSFLKYKPFGSEFIGLKNYQDTFSSSLFYKTVLNTLEYTVVVVPLSLLMAFAISIMILPFSKKTQSVFKSMYYLPGIASGVALSVVWLWIYDSSPTGLMNQVFPAPAHAELALLQQNVHDLADVHGADVRSGKQHHHLYCGSAGH